MNRKHLIGVTMAAIAASLGWSCTMDPYLMTPEEEYVRAFIKDFGLVDSEQDWNTAESAKVKIDLGTVQPNLVKVYARKGEKYYLVASLQGITGNIDVPVDVPKGTTEVLVSVDGNYYMGKIDTPIMCTGAPAKVKSRSVDLSRSSISEETRQFVYDPNNPAYEFSTTMSATGETYGVKVDIDPNKEYRYFNSRQMGPIIGHSKYNEDEKKYEYNPWPSYWSLDAKEYIKNESNDIGLLPEKGKENATMRTTDPRVVDDFVYKAEKGEFYITPLFYGSNLQHVLGVFLLDPVTEQPLMAADGVTVIKFPIFENKHDDDIKLKELPYEPVPTSIDFTFSGDRGLYVDGYGNEVFLLTDGDDAEKSYIFNIKVKDQNGTDITDDFINDINLDNQYADAIYDVSKSGNTITVTAKTIGDQWTKIMYNGKEIGSFHVFVDSKSTPRSLGIDKKNVADEYNHCIAEDGSIHLKKGETAVFPFKLYKLKDEWGAAKGEEVTLPSSIKINEILTKTGWYNQSYDLIVNDDYTITLKALDNPEKNEFWDCLFFDFKMISDTYTYIEEPNSKKICSLHVFIDDATSQAKARKSKSRGSRAEDSEFEKLTEPGGNLHHDENTVWKDINKFYDPKEFGVNSYLTTEQRLVRSRIYHVKLTVDGKPWDGKFGFYIDYDWYDDPENPEDGSITTGARSRTGRHYSMRSLNTYYSTEKDETASGGSLPVGTKFNYCYAATYKHPISSDLRLMSFEDMSNTHPGPNDMGLAPDGTTRYGYKYTDWSWASNTGDYSSDRDLNDIIFLVEGVQVETPPEDPTVEIVETGFNWYWAVEDLGATDDFDFNDVVFKISSITQSRREQQVDGEGKPVVDGDKNPVWGDAKIMKCVEFTPMAAGGTMETYARWTYNKINYCLAPGVYYEDDAIKPSDGDLKPLSALDASQISKDSCEIHKWFGVDNYTEMINTMSTSSHHKAKGTCKIYFNPKFTLAGFGECTDKQAIDGKGKGLSISIGDPNVELGTDKINEEMAQEEYCVEKPKKGEPAQMFIINCDEWHWATERTHIKQAYPDFGRWVSDKNDATDWYKRPTSGKVY